MTFLGHVVSKEGIRVDPAKIEAVKGWMRPTSPTEIRVLWDWQAIIKNLFRVSLLVQLH